MFLSNESREKFLSFLEEYYELDREFPDSHERMGFHQRLNLSPMIQPYSFLAQELIGRPSQANFLSFFRQTLELGVFSNVDWDYVRSLHEGGGAFWSEIVVDMYTKPCVAAIAVLTSLRGFIPEYPVIEVDRFLSDLLACFGSLSWGHGIERVPTVCQYVRLWSMAGAFPLCENSGHLEVFSPVFDRLLREALEPAAFGGADPIRELEMKIRMGAIGHERETIPQELLSEVEDRAPYILWILNGVIPAKRMITLLKTEKRLWRRFDSAYFPWHAVKLSATDEDIKFFSKMGKMIDQKESSERDVNQVLLLLKLDSLERI
ncbi:MAG: hypothetical protein ACFFCZ_09400 [Promethearchaeota archaeon]